ncbi:MAG: hypothetical protein EOQ44_25265 [Mesorhizobium sp.]|uniref:hypothetical protein n=1 Tax=Mesorhizobium sp. TaxID=1871066 RepID=UPI000FE7F092|nr:hypothetical protein [Mesorhizobium sp.]RWB40454.1 MAG: hypothetical protein EOQ44_25265 [Mesorhizobium sp.]
MSGPGDQLVPIIEPLIDRALCFIAGVVIGFCGFWLLVTPARPAEQTQLRRQCLVDVNPVGKAQLFVPCRRAEPSRYPMVWWWEGQEV